MKIYSMVDTDSIQVRLMMIYTLPKNNLNHYYNPPQINQKLQQ